MPGEAGVARKPWFLCQKSFYNCGQIDDSGELETRESRNAENVNKFFEQDPSNLTAGIKVFDVRKVFGLLFAKKVAVDSVSINFFQDQITVLLGHNGAGKTTLMSIIAGFLSPSRGTVILNGFDISKHMKEARKRLGLCPQFNILYETLTVHEHLKLFALLKGLSCAEMKTEISTVATELGLSTLLKRKAGKISGGQQRMLSLALALLGNPKVVILDEPSAGMDVGKRQECWNVLRRARVGRTILMTTHYMDEAEAMGDRIAIMVEGRVVCCGTALYLRKAYGAGYHLLFCLKPGYDSQVVLRMIKKYIPDASLKSEVHGDVSITLPTGAERFLPTVLKSLEEKRKELGISDLGMAATTMEEIFLKAGTDVPGYVSSESSLKENNLELDSISTISNSTDSSDGNVDNNEDNKDNNNNPGSSDRIRGDLSKTITHPKAPVKLQGPQLLIARVVVLLFKRQKMAAAEWIKTLCQIGGPIIVAFLALDDSNSEHTSTSERSLTLAGLPRMRVPYKVTNYGHQKQIDMTELYGKQFNDLSSVTMEKVDEKTGFDDYALNKITDIGLPEYLSHMIIGFEALDLKLNDTNKSLEFAIAYYSPLPVRSREISVNYALNAMFQTALDETHSIQASIGLFERRKKGDDEMMMDNIMKKILGIFSRFKINFVLAFLPILAAYFAGLEKKLGSRHLQALSGATPALYWLTSLVWDLIFLLICGTPVFVIIIWMTYEGLGIFQWSIMFLCFTVHGTAILSIAYLSNCFLKSPTSVVIICLISSILIGCTGSLVYSIATLVQKDLIAESSRAIAMATSPSFNMGKCFENIWMNKINGDKCRNVQCISGRLNPCCFDEATCKKVKMYCAFIFIRWGENYFAWDDPGVGPYLLAMFLQTVGFFLLMLLIDGRILHKLWSITETKVAKVTDKDSDVAEERARVEATLQGQNTDVLTIYNLYKCYGTRIAVNCVTSGVMSGECFGLLGQNGAGKTSIFKCLTGATHPTSGKIKVMGVDLRKAKDAVGYCPQFEGLIPSLTGRDQIALYARLRGFTKESIQETSNWLGKLFLFEELLDLPCRVYSGGNKRKLNCAIAMVGEPSLLLLDEPSWGMDPQARRHMWDALKYARDHGSTLVLSSHSMEECEALITRMVIMKNGTFRAMGSIQHVKSKFKEGYTLTLQLTNLEDGNVPPVEPVDEFITTKLPKTEFLEQRDNYLTYRIHDVEGNLGDIFEILEKSKNTLGINNYQVQQTTLEQVFIALTHTEEEPLLDTSRQCAAWIGL